MDHIPHFSHWGVFVYFGNKWSPWVFLSCSYSSTSLSSFNGLMRRVSKFVMVGWHRKSCKADLHSFIAHLQSSLIQALLGFAFLVEVFGMELLAIDIKVLVKNISWLSSGVVSVNKLLHRVWNNVQLALVIFQCGSFSHGKELFEDKITGRWSLPCKSSSGF